MPTQQTQSQNTFISQNPSTMKQVCKASSVYQTHFLQMMSFNVLNKPVSTRPAMLMFQTKVFVLVLSTQYHALLVSPTLVSGVLSATTAAIVTSIM